VFSSLGSVSHSDSVTAAEKKVNEKGGLPLSPLFFFSNGFFFASISFSKKTMAAKKLFLTTAGEQTDPSRLTNKRSLHILILM
jgi:hypothetical protein